MDAKDILNLQEAYLEVYQEQKLDEGLKKAFIKAYGRAYAAAGDDYADEDDFEREAKIRSHIERRYGPETAKHADEHGYVQSTGRRYGRPEPRIQPNRKFKTTKAGKMPKNAQKAFKNELILNKSERDSPTIGGVRKPKHWGKVGGEKGLPEQVDLYDIILSHLLDEGYAETQQAAEAIMVNMSEDWRESICEELTGERKKRALQIGTELAKRVALAKEGQPITRKGPPYLGSTKKAPSKRGGSGIKGDIKAVWTGYADDRGSGNKSRRRRGIKVQDTSDEL